LLAVAVAAADAIIGMGFVYHVEQAEMEEQGVHLLD
jgi:hypothetical protein